MINKADHIVYIGGILTILSILYITLLSIDSKADSLVCEHKGKTLIYTEVYSDDNDKPRDVKTITSGNNWSRVRFYDGASFYFGGIIPCVFINDERGSTTNLNEFLSQFDGPESNDFMTLSPKTGNKIGND